MFFEPQTPLRNRLINLRCELTLRLLSCHNLDLFKTSSQTTHDTSPEAVRLK